MAAGEKLLILLKAPVRGLVKTRLATELGSDAALATYRQLLDGVLREMAVINEVELHYAPASEQALIATLLKPGWCHRPQAEGDLGTRMHQAFAHAFQAGAQRVVMIGTDCPEVNATDIHAAWAALSQHDLVLGPAEDGGYWLIGLKQPQPELFRGIQWSTSSVLAETIARAQQLGLRYQLLHTLSDVDTKADWDAYLARHSAQVLE